MRAIQIALDKYYQKYGRYPDADGDGCCDRWDIGLCRKDGRDGFLPILVKEGFSDKDRGAPLFYNHCQGYFYHRYDCHNKSPYYPCYGCEKPFYVLGIKKLESKKTIRIIRPIILNCYSKCV